jgi:hypothetical protein
MNRRNYIGHKVDVSNGDFTDVGTEKGIIHLNETSTFPDANRGYVEPDFPTLANNILLYAPLNGNGMGFSGNGSVEPSFLIDAISNVGTSSTLSNTTVHMANSDYSGYTPAIAGRYLETSSSILTNLEVGTSSPFSVQFWWYNTGAQSGNYARIISFGGYGDSGTGIECESNSTSTSRFLFFEFNGGTTNRQLQSEKIISTAGWHHIYWSCDPTGGNTYLGIDGTVTEHSHYIDSVNPSSVNFSLGGVVGGEDSTQGNFQELIISNDVPYTGNYTPNTTPLLPYPEDTGFTYVDQSGQSNTTSVTDFSCPLPANAVSGDLAVAAIWSDFNNVNQTAPSGWTLIGNGNDTEYPKSYVYAKVLDSADITAGSISATASVSNAYMAQIVTFRSNNAIHFFSGQNFSNVKGSTTLNDTIDGTGVISACIACACLCGRAADQSPTLTYADADAIKTDSSGSGLGQRSFGYKFYDTANTTVSNHTVSSNDTGRQSLSAFYIYVYT